MSLRDRVQTDIAVAMRGGDALRRDTLRMAVSAAYNVEKRNQHPLTDDEFLAVLTREVAATTRPTAQYSSATQRFPRGSSRRTHRSGHQDELNGS